MKKNFVTKEELMKKRTPQELIEWFKCKIEEVSKQKDGKEALREGKGFCKELMEEIYPLSIWARLKYGERNDIKLQSIIGDQNYDALIIDHTFYPPSESKLEITIAHEGEQEYLRVLCLKEHGWAPQTGPIKKTGTKNKNIGKRTEPSWGVISFEDKLNGIKYLTDKALENKLNKKYENNTSLLIMYPKRISDDYINEIEKDIKNFIENKLERIKAQFSHLYFVLESSSKYIFLDF